MGEIGVTVAQEFMPGSRVSVHRATGVYSQGMEGPELESGLADHEGSVSFSTLSGFDVSKGEKLWVIGRNPAGALHCVAMAAKASTSAKRVKARQATTVSAHEDDLPAGPVQGARTTTNTRAAPRKASPRRAQSPRKPAAAKAPAKKAAAKPSAKARGKSGKK